MKDPYKKLGLRRVINAATSLTRLGGSIADPTVYRAMEEASKSFVQIPELQHWAGKAIAEASKSFVQIPELQHWAGKAIAEAKPHPGVVEGLEEFPYFLSVHVRALKKVSNNLDADR